jgi:hypothetical protein
VKPAQPPSPYRAAARFADSLFAWWLLRTAARDAPPPEKHDDAVHRWEDEGGNVR